MSSRDTSKKHLCSSYFEHAPSPGISSLGLECAFGIPQSNQTWLWRSNRTLLKLILPAIGGTKTDGRKLLSWALPVPSTRTEQRKKRRCDQHQSYVHAKALLCLNQGTPRSKPRCYSSLSGVSLTQPFCWRNFTFYKITPGTKLS